MTQIPSNRKQSRHYNKKNRTRIEQASCRDLQIRSYGHYNSRGHPIVINASMDVVHSQPQHISNIKHDQAPLSFLTWAWASFPEIYSDFRPKYSLGLLRSRYVALAEKSPPLKYLLKGGILSGDNPVNYNASDPFRLWVIQVG